MIIARRQVMATLTIASTFQSLQLAGVVVTILLFCFANVIDVVRGLPVLAPNIAVCKQGTNDTASLQCCAPSPSFPPRAFEFSDDGHSVVRVRRPAHRLSDQEAQRLARAYEIMRALPETDPRSYGHQANIHCAYCNEFYTQPNSTVPLQIHASWLFFSFHRWYLYFHERILGALINDTSLALPFWNYDHPDGSTMPRVYVEHEGLTHEYREPSHLPPAVAAVDTVSWGQQNRRREDQLTVNLEAFHWVMVTGATTQFRFFGQPYRWGDYQMPGYGTAETMPHNSLHSWTGDSEFQFRDMGVFSTAARDPIFYAHHSNLDRLWDAWKNISDLNLDIDDPDYLDSEFVFYDENAELVKVSVRDSLSSARLGYSYEPVDNLWLNQTPVSLSGGLVAKLSDDALLCTFGDPLASTCSLLVEREPAKAGGADDEETLLFEGIHVPDGLAPAQFSVFLNLPEANVSTTPGCREFAGTFSTLVPTTTTTTTSLRLPISSMLVQLNLASETSVVVTLVVPTPPSTTPSGRVSISSVSVEYQVFGSQPANMDDEAPVSAYNMLL